MDKWEYWSGCLELDSKELNKMGSEGWELVSSQLVNFSERNLFPGGPRWQISLTNPLMMSANYLYCVFKRKK